MSAMKTVYTAEVTVTGGRDGRATSSDKNLDVRLSMPKELGGSGAPGTTNPEQLFAAGYAACFQSALRAVAGNKGMKITDSSIRARVGVGPRDAGGFGINVAMEVKLEGVTREQAQQLVEIAHRDMCPYSHATRNNVDVAIKLA
jgi:osmotically inducible protein OsmC